MTNSKSLTSIPVLYQKVNESFPIFSQATDAILFQNVHEFSDDCVSGIEVRREFEERG